MAPSYIESPRPPPTLPQMIRRPRCSMKPVIVPALPPTMIVPPFWSMPERAPTSPRTTTSPPRSAAPVSEPAFLSMTTTPDIMFSATDQPTRPFTWISGPSIRPQLQVDLPGGQVGRVERGGGAVLAAGECRGPGCLGAGLGQAAGVVADLHLFHTSPSRS